MKKLRENLPHSSLGPVLCSFEQCPCADHIDGGLSEASRCFTWTHDKLCLLQRCSYLLLASNDRPTVFVLIHTYFSFYEDINPSTCSLLFSLCTPGLGAHLSDRCLYQSQLLHRTSYPSQLLQSPSRLWLW